MNTDAFHYYTRLEKVKCFVEENYPEEISLQEAANVACMERTSFSRFFWKQGGSLFYSVVEKNPNCQGQRVDEKE